jgi:hypothetical protein
VKKLPYREGDVFSVPLTSGKFSVGVIARADKKGKVVLAYFFDIKLSENFNLKLLPEMNVNNAIFVKRIGDLGLISGDWKIVGSLDNWHRDQWPIPKFLRKPVGDNQGWIVTYGDDNLLVPASEERCAKEDLEMDRDGIAGAGFVEKTLSKLLNN